MKCEVFFLRMELYFKILTCAFACVKYVLFFVEIVEERASLVDGRGF
jgi:hypothetical protein